MIRPALLAAPFAVLLPLAAPAMAQPVDHSMHGHGAAPAPAPAAAPAPAQPMDHSMHNHGAAPAPAPAPAAAAAQPVDHSAHSHEAPPPAAQGAPSAEPVGTDQSPGTAPPPPIAHDRPADRYWGAAAMAAAEAAEMHPPAPLWSRLTVDLAELQARPGADHFRWEAEGWLGNVDRLVLRTQGEGPLGAAPDDAEVEAYYARALDPWWNLALGLRQDLSAATPRRTFAALGVTGRARYQFDVHAFAYLSDRGELTARLEAAHDLRLTQWLVLQPRVEITLSAQDMPDRRTGPGLTEAELGLRLRYELQREFAPYVGLSWTGTTGRTAAYARADRQPANSGSLVAGLRFWF